MTQFRSFIASLPLSGFCHSFTLQQAFLLQPNLTIERPAWEERRQQRGASSGDLPRDGIGTIEASKGDENLTVDLRPVPPGRRSAS